VTNVNISIQAMEKISKSDLETILALMHEHGDFAEIYLEQRAGTQLMLDGQVMEDASGGTDSGVALRIIKNGITYFANGNRSDASRIKELAENLAKDIGARNPAKTPPLQEQNHPEVSHVTLLPSDIPPDDKAKIMIRADAAAREYSGEIIQVTVHYRDSIKDFLVANTDGTCARDCITITTLAVLAVGKKGDVIRSGWKTASQSTGFELFKSIKPEDVAREAARLAVLQLNARPAPAGTFTVVLSSKAGGTMVHEACGHGLEADYFEKGVSVYSGKIGQKVASQHITVIDDGTMLNMRGSSKFDEEGYPSKRVVLIENGVMKGLLQSRKTSRKMKMPQTGNGRRESYRHLPVPRMRNTYIAPGQLNPEEIIAQVKKGVFVADMGGGEVETVSGNFVFHCSEAYLIQNGKVTDPIRDAILTGNGPEILNKIDAVGNDLGFQTGTCGKEGQSIPVSNGQPTLRIPGIVVGGSSH
jgi:TldD protein